MAAQAVGFDRPEMYQSPLTGTVSFHHKHVFVCYKNPASWPSVVESGELGGNLPNSLFAAFKARKKDMGSKIRLTICEQGPGTSEGDVLVFPDMLRYRGLRAEEANSFVEEVMVKGKRWRLAERLSGHHVFVCAHGSRDARCGSCGPELIDKFRGEIGQQGLDGKVGVRACSHIGGHKFAGNVIIFGGTPVTGHWYGYVTPHDVSLLLEQHVRRGQVVDRLWRGQMGLTEDEQKQRQMARAAENTCPCGMSQGECGSKQAMATSAALGVRRKGRQQAMKRPWELKRNKVALAVLILGCSTAMALCYYIPAKLKLVCLHS